MPQSVITLPRSPLHIVAVGLHDLRHLLETLIPQYRTQAEVTLIEKAYDAAVNEIAAHRAHTSIDAIVAAGSNGDYLRQHLDIPVVLVRVTGFDVMQGLSRATQMSNRVALVTFDSVSEEIQQFVETFSLPVQLRSYRNEEQARLCVAELKASGIEVVVAPGLVVDLARENGLKGILIYSQRLVEEAVEDAVEVGRLRRSELAKRDRINTILGELRDGVVAVDVRGQIEFINPAMEKILGRSARELIHTPINGVLPELDMLATLRDQQAELEQVQKLAGKTLLTSRLPIIEQGRLTGAVLICQDPEAIRRMDRNLRTRSATRAHTVRYDISDIVGFSPAIKRVRQMVTACATSDATVLITGESGTGKEMVAQSIHAQSQRANLPFVAINCGAFPEALLESELFGYIEGAFTGASRAGKVGLFEAAHTGTIFLDEIAEMPASLQTRLLRVLQEKQVLRIGATEPTPIDVRVIAATHQDLAPRMAEGGFRQDLYYRLNILQVYLPPLRERTDDVRPLVDALCSKWQKPESNQDVFDGLIEALLQQAHHYSWPGNVRELENVLERLMVLSQLHAPGGSEFRALHELVPELFQENADDTTTGRSLERYARDQELIHIEKVLHDCGGNQAEAARLLNISRTTLWRRLKQGRKDFL